MPHPFLPTLFFVMLLNACTNTATDSNKSSTQASTATISCAGVDKIKPNHTEADLISLYGKENVSRDSLYAEGMAIAIASYVYKNKPEELEILWQENAEFQKIGSIRITQENAPYQTANGIKIGTALKEIEKLNGAPVAFSGFGWDYGGGCCNYGQGTMTKTMPCLSMQLVITDPDLEKKASESEITSVMGDREVTSDNPIFDKIAVSINGLQVSFMQ